MKSENISRIGRRISKKPRFNLMVFARTEINHCKAASLASHRHSESCTPATY